MDFEVVCYVADPPFNTYMKIQRKINLSLMSKFSDARVKFAFPTARVTLPVLRRGHFAQSGSVPELMPTPPALPQADGRWLAQPRPSRHDGVRFCWLRKKSPALLPDRRKVAPHCVGLP
ncbi:hypothetical protein Bphyt_6371 [Paraburkholderia phytofirmans PsJN]|uniref:Uncharacterized protein n=1 Tax=Paraburkholderia phytofirmans (strain DSM 17436 / LMG 22146 / PsJN) TaxID=398527 RepID=B2T8M7_PARPJ|nr:hypothetical protein Bphyt_6371 [Paraburkholderia phytofirmans PsJN]